MKTSERIHWNENFPKYVTAMVEKNRLLQNRLAAQIAREAGATVAQVYMVALNQKRGVICG